MNTDFVSFARKLKIVGKDGSLIPLVPTPALLAYEEQRTNRDVVKKLRQMGMTTWEMARSLWFASSNEGVFVEMIVLDDAAISNPEAWLRTTGKHAEADGLIETSGPMRGGRNRQLTFRNGSVITIRPIYDQDDSIPKLVRMHTTHRLHVAEAAYLHPSTRGRPQRVEDAGLFIESMLLTVPATGEVVLESSVEGINEERATLFTEIFRKGRLENSAWKSHELGGPTFGGSSRT